MKFKDKKNKEKEKLSVVPDEKKEMVSTKEYGVMICSPLDKEYVSSVYFLSFISLYTNDKIYRRFCFNNEFPIDHCRNQMVKEALSDKRITHIWFVDTDMGFPRDAMTGLLGHDKDIAGLLCFTRRPPTILPIIYQTHPENPDLRRHVVEYRKGLHKFDSTGTGCLMVKREVFEKIPPPWFKITEYKGNPVGEDIYFCNKAREAGYDIWVDTANPCKHLGFLEIGEPHYNVMREKYIEEQKAKGMITSTEV